MEDKKSLVEIEILPIEAKLLKLLPLSGITHKHGVDGLLKRALGEIKNFDKNDQEQIRGAIELAAMFHGRDTYKAMPYMTHLLRVMIRLIRDYEITDPVILAAAVLHDSIEDHEAEIIAFTRYKFSTAEDALASITSNEIASLVQSLANSKTTQEQSQADKNQAYLDGVAQKLMYGFETFIIKLSDFSDNAIGIHWGEDPVKSQKVAQKYLPVFEVFEAACTHYLSTGDLSQKCHDFALKQLANGRMRCTEIIAA